MMIIPPCMRKCRQSVQSLNPPSLNRTPTSARCLSGICILGNWSPFWSRFWFWFRSRSTSCLVHPISLPLSLSPSHSYALSLSLCLSFLLIAFFGY